MDTDQTIPYGYCHCGCGQKTNIARKSNAAMGHVKGEPYRYLAQHHRRKSPVDFIEDSDTHCWIWQGGLCGSDYASGGGYGVTWRDGRAVGAHRAYYEDLVGPIPDGLVIDHLCRTRSCVNPGHMEPVTSAENTLRGESPMARKARQTHCIHGHPLSGDNVYVQPNGRRRCRACDRDRHRARWESRHPLI